MPRKAKKDNRLKLLETLTIENVDEHIQKLIDIHLVTDGGKSKGWAHTHGMNSLGYPDLEIRGVPLFLGPDAATLLNHVAGYIMTCKRPVLVGQKMAISPMQVFLFKDGCAEPIDDDPEVIKSHYKDERLWLSDEPLVSACAHGVDKKKVH